MARKKGNTPRHKKMKKSQRLQSAKNWIPEYDGKNLVQGYRSRFGVDLLCAINELTLLGIAVDPEYIQKVKISVANKIKENAARKKKKQSENGVNIYSDSNDQFYYISGYTSGGAPYGVTWEEMGLEPYEVEEEDISLTRAMNLEC